MAFSGYITSPIRHQPPGKSNVRQSNYWVTRVLVQFCDKRPVTLSTETKLRLRGPTLLTYPVQTQPPESATLKTLKGKGQDRCSWRKAHQDASTGKLSLWNAMQARGGYGLLRNRTYHVMQVEEKFGMV
ncbi:hypothetical protein QYF61_020899 [Mycteria americana]|uniref:Uncharacterized protein n=1 Tax=Mycteria americana TaxID=33587 RepID=A0AAN7S4W7_MYCAM|nr:hypothetical protein QYF61_020899 [Mycteria americana]